MSFCRFANRRKRQKRTLIKRGFQRGWSKATRVGSEANHEVMKPSGVWIAGGNPDANPGTTLWSVGGDLNTPPTET
ncbi:MAG: hypothetical protein WC610_03295 [Patescibacteria group bacterium]